MTKSWPVVAQSVVVAVLAYVAAAIIESAVIRTLRPTELELAWLSDVFLATAFGAAVYLWRHLQASRQELAARERAAVVLQTQLSIAADIQRRLLPELPSRAYGIDWAAALRSASEIGGDFYDVVELSPGRWLVLAADVSGKGVPAAMALGWLRGTFRTLARDHDDPARVLALLSDALQDEWNGTPYVTAIVARLDARDRSLCVVNGGHPPGIVTGPSGARLLSASGSPAGLLPHATFAEVTIALHPGDVCLFVSDGVTEALEDGQAPPTERIVATAERHRGSARSVCDAVMDIALRGKGPPGVADWTDDRTVFVIACLDGTTADTPASGRSAGR